MCGLGTIDASGSLLPLLTTAMLLCTTLVGAGIGWALLLGRRTPHSLQPVAPLPPAELLRERYARGEIDLDEFEERITRLMRSLPEPS